VLIDGGNLFSGDDNGILIFRPLVRLFDVIVVDVVDTDDDDDDADLGAVAALLVDEEVV
jgi:hypothetical protein